MLYTWIYIHLQAQRPLPRYTVRVQELRRGGQDKSDANRAERPPTPSPPWSPCVCDRRRGMRGGGGGLAAAGEGVGRTVADQVGSAIGAL